jgi:hypothetical protein
MITVKLGTFDAPAFGTYNKSELCQWVKNNNISTHMTYIITGYQFILYGIMTEKQYFEYNIKFQ